MSTVALSDVKIDEEIYPRVGTDPDVVGDYAAAIENGAGFPPIVLMSDNRLLDGAHRVAAYMELGLDEIEAVYADPADPLEFAIRAQIEHGKQMSRDDKRHAAGLMLIGLKLDEDFPAKTIAGTLNVTERTVRNWFADIIEARAVLQERRRVALGVAVNVLAQAGWSQDRMASTLKVPQRTLSDRGKLSTSAEQSWGETVASVWTDVRELIPLDEADALLGYFLEHVTLDEDLAGELADGTMSALEAMTEQTVRSDEQAKADARSARQIQEIAHRWSYWRSYLVGDRAQQIAAHWTEAERSKVAAMQKEMA